MPAAFADRVIDSIYRFGSPLCVGLDPFAHLIPSALFGDPRSDVSALGRFSEALLTQAAAHTGVVKIQLGLFEPFGPEGVAAAREACRFAQGLGLVTILDAKRGDIGSTAEGYAAAALGPRPGFDADCVTVAPYMGVDSLLPFVEAAETRGKGVAVLVRTSNPGARDLQDLLVDGSPLWTKTAAMIAPLQTRLRAEGEFSSLMVVAGATYPEQARLLRQLLPEALFLVPGYGAQGASAGDAVAGFVPGPKGLVGGVVNASRSVSYPTAAASAATLHDWRSAIDAAMNGAKRDLEAAVSG
jgi:orotidine-5'-phosphate decarboxylase